MLGVGRRMADGLEAGRDGRHASRRAPDGAAAARRDPTPSPSQVCTSRETSAGQPAAALAPETSGERDAWAILASVQGLGPATLGALVRAESTATSVLEVAASPAGRRRLAALEVGEGRRVSADVVERIAAASLDRARLLAEIAAEDLAVVTLDDAAYPPRLRAIEQPPPVLFVRGNVAALGIRQAVAVVGTRRPTERGRRLAGWIASAIADCGASVVSGLAIGIDGAAQAAVVGRSRPTVGILGGGHRSIYPRAHERLADAIVAEGGAIVSELPPQAAPTRGTFPRRNRVISGLAQATVVVEAGLRSGALITACWALEQGRECFVVPGPLDEPASAGCLAFLRAYPDRARLVAGVPELLEDLSLEPERESTNPLQVPDLGDGAPPDGTATTARLDAALAGLGRAEQAVAEALQAGASSVDALVAASGLEVATVLGTLTLLEIRGLVTSAYGRYRAAGRLAGWPGPGLDGARRSARGHGADLPGRRRGW